MAENEGPAPPIWRRWAAIAWTALWFGCTLGLVFLAVAQWTGLDPAPDTEAALGAILVACLTTPLGIAGVAMVRAARETALRPPRIPPPPDRTAPAIPLVRTTLPSRASAARRPAKDLADAESALTTLVRRMRQLPRGTAVPDDVLDEVAHTAIDMASSLRTLAMRVEAVELAARHAPLADRPDLEDGVGSLMTHLEQGLEAYRGLISAAGRVLIASTPSLATDELVEATDRLQGLAEALRELSAPDDHA
jgi:hypothetical protein